MKLASTLIAAAAAELSLLPLQLEWSSVARGKKCSSSAMSSTTFPYTKVEQVNVTFDMTKNSEKALKGMRASLKIDTKKKNKYQKCKPVNPKQLKTAARDGDMLTITMNCPSVESSEIRIDARGAMCPEYENIEALAYQLVCDDGFEAVDGECVDIDECATGSACAGVATCTNTEGSFTCHCDGYGDGYTGCVPLGPCHPGQAGGTIAPVGDFNLTMNTYWNSTEYDCTYEYTLDQFTDEPVGSWNLGIALPATGKIEGIWRAVDVNQSNGVSLHVVYPESFNPNGLHTDITFHVTYDQECDSMDEDTASSLSFDYCSSDPIATTTVAATAAPTAATTAASTEAPLVLGPEVCHTANYDVTGSWVQEEQTKRQVTIQFGNSAPAHNWRVIMKADSQITEMTTWNAEWDAASATLTAKDYNQVLSAGSSLGIIFCLPSGDAGGYSMEVCYQSEMN